MMFQDVLGAKVIISQAIFPIQTKLSAGSRRVSQSFLFFQLSAISKSGFLLSVYFQFSGCCTTSPSMKRSANVIFLRHLCLTDRRFL